MVYLSLNALENTDIKSEYFAPVHLIPGVAVLLLFGAMDAVYIVYMVPAYADPIRECFTTHRNMVLTGFVFIVLCHIDCIAVLFVKAIYEPWTQTGGHDPFDSGLPLVGYILAVLFGMISLIYGMGFTYSNTYSRLDWCPSNITTMYLEVNATQAQERFETVNAVYCFINLAPAMLGCVYVVFLLVVGIFEGRGG